MKRALGLALAGLFLLAGTASAVTPTAAIWLASVDSTTAVIHVEQTNTPLVTLNATIYCNRITPRLDGLSDATFTGKETQTFVGSADLSFYVGPQRVKGKTVSPTQCSATIWQKPSETHDFAYLPPFAVPTV